MASRTASWMAGIGVRDIASIYYTPARLGGRARIGRR
jgi:hypothetical protein